MQVWQNRGYGHLGQVYSSRKVFTPSGPLVVASLVETFYPIFSQF